MVVVCLKGIVQCQGVTSITECGVQHIQPADTSNAQCDSRIYIYIYQDDHQVSGLGPFCPTQMKLGFSHSPLSSRVPFTNFLSGPGGSQRKLAAQFFAFLLVSFLSPVATVEQARFCLLTFKGSSQQKERGLPLGTWTFPIPRHTGIQLCLTEAPTEKTADLSDT